MKIKLLKKPKKARITKVLGKTSGKMHSWVEIDNNGKPRKVRKQNINIG